MWSVLLAIGSQAAERDFQGRLELAPVTGWFVPSPKIALKSSLVYGVELDHFFLGTGPAVVFGVYAKVQGSRTNVKESGQHVDVIFGSAGVTIGPAGLGRWLPLLRVGEGFFLADGTPGGLQIQGRVAGEVGAGLRFLATEHVALRVDVDSVVHDNLQLGAGSGEIGDAWHLNLIGGISVMR